MGYINVILTAIFVFPVLAFFITLPYIIYNNPLNQPTIVFTYKYFLLLFLPFSIHKPIVRELYSIPNTNITTVIINVIIEKILFFLILLLPY